MLMAEILSTALVKKGECFRFIAADFGTIMAHSVFPPSMLSGATTRRRKRVGIRVMLVQVWFKAAPG